MEATTTNLEAEPEPFEEPEARVTALELFFDLVFVFAFTQVTALMAANPTWERLGQGMLVLAMVWWAWGGYAWLTNALHSEDGIARVGLRPSPSRGRRLARRGVDRVGCRACGCSPSPTSIATSIRAHGSSR